MMLNLCVRGPTRTSVSQNFGMYRTTSTDTLISIQFVSPNVQCSPYQEAVGPEDVARRYRDQSDEEYKASSVRIEAY